MCIGGTNPRGSNVTTISTCCMGDWSTFKDHIANRQIIGHYDIHWVEHILPIRVLVLKNPYRHTHDRFHALNNYWIMEGDIASLGNYMYIYIEKSLNDNDKAHLGNYIKGWTYDPQFCRPRRKKYACKPRPSHPFHHRSTQGTLPLFWEHIHPRSINEIGIILKIMWNYFSLNIRGCFSCINKC